MNKTCQRCHTTKLLNEFGVNKAKPDGKNIYCKVCVQKQSVEDYRNNPENRRERARQFRLLNKDNPGYKNKKHRWDKKYRTQHKTQIQEKLQLNRTQRLKRRRELKRKQLVNHPEIRMLESTKERAKKKGLVNTLSRSDIKIPPFCPVLGIPLRVASGHPNSNSPSIDRIDNSKGYTPDNIIVVSYKANTIKNSATVEELEKITTFYKGLQQ